MFKIFFSRFVMSRSGRSQEMFAHSQALPAAKLFFSRTEQALMHGTVSNNFYLSYVLLGKNSKLLPYYLQEEVFGRVKAYQNLNVVHCDILSFLKTIPNGSIDKFNLSDIFEPISIESTNTIFDEIYRTAKPSARIIFWNNLVGRDVPVEMKHCFERDIVTENELRKSDKIFFYEKFLIYTVVK